MRQDKETLDLIERVRKIEIRTRRLVDSLTAGAYHSAFKGRGIEFDEVREYAEGDDVRFIDWNVTARMQQTYIKQFIEERDLSVYLLMDISGSMDIQKSSVAKYQTAIDFGALISFSAIRNNDRVGLLQFTEKDEQHIKPRKGRRHALRIIRDLLSRERQSRKTNLRKALRSFMQTHKRRAVLFVVSDFIDDDYLTELKMVRQRHDVICIHIQNPNEHTLPGGALVSIKDSETGKQGGLLSLLGKKLSSGEENNIGKQLINIGLGYVPLTAGEDVIKPLLAFFKKRQMMNSHK
ncbi:MAG: DUF58 domain-containing protein [Lentisphaeria bacterium]|nr:DUF58 domain-containing protein [Lentisphaeria bacterium]